MKPIFILLTDVLKLHQDQISRYGGTHGTRDITLLKSALGCPSATYSGQFLHTNIYEMAAAYLFHIVKNHPFIDGNKRTGVIVALTFLMINDYDFNAPKEDLIQTVLLIAQGKLGKPEITIFIQRWSTATHK